MCIPSLAPLLLALFRPVRPTSLVVLVTALVATSVPAHPQGDPVRDFLEIYEPGDEPASRVEAVLILEGYESPRVVDALLPLFDREEAEVVLAGVRVLGAFRTRPPVERMFALLERGSLERRLALLEGLARGGYAAQADALEGSLADRRWEVREAAVAALASSRDPADLARLEAFLDDAEPAVRCAAIEGLAAIDPQVLLRCAPAALADGSWRVRACVIAALATVRDRRSVALLIPRIRAEEGRLVQDLTNALTGLTGRAFGLDPEPWERFWESVGERYEPPTEDELARLAARREQTAERYAGDVVRYHGLETPSHAILFVIDVSASMEQLVVGTAGKREGEEELRRIDLVKQELVSAIAELAPYVRFNVLAFSTEVGAWKRSLVPASRPNKRAARRWVERLDAEGGASRQQTFRVRENVTPAVASRLLDLESGRTNTYAALMQGLDAGGRGVFDRHYDVGVDTILFLSDGSPSHGEVVAPDDILREVSRANRLRRVVIHTIAIGEFNKDFMQELAEQNGGVFRDLGS